MTRPENRVRGERSRRVCGVTRISEKEEPMGFLPGGDFCFIGGTHQCLRQPTGLGRKKTAGGSEEKL